MYKAADFDSLGQCLVPALHNLPLSGQPQGIAPTIKQSCYKDSTIARIEARSTG